MSNIVYLFVAYGVGILTGILLAVFDGHFDVSNEHLVSALSQCSQHAGLKKVFIESDGMKVVCNSGMVLEAEMK